MDEHIHFNLSSEQIEKIDFYSKILNKDPNDIFNEALNVYFDAQEKILSEQEAGQNPETNLDYDEFWDGVDL